MPGAISQQHIQQGGLGRRHHTAKGENTAAWRCSRTAKRTPKVTLAVDTRAHLVLAVKVQTGRGADTPQFLPIVRAAQKRHRGLHRVLADAGFDSHHNHQVAPERLELQTLIKARTGRPTGQPPTSKYWRQMAHQLAGRQAGKPYGQRAQSAMVNSMLKGNRSDSLRCRITVRRRHELCLRAVVHNIAIIRARKRRVKTDPSRPLFRVVVNRCCGEPALHVQLSPLALTDDVTSPQNPQSDPW